MWGTNQDISKFLVFASQTFQSTVRLLVVMMSTFTFCWSVENPLSWLNSDYEPEVRALIRDVRVSWSQKTSSLSWLPQWPLFRCVAHFQESLNNRDKIILRYTPQPRPTCNLQRPLLNSLPPSSHIPKLPTVQLRLIDMFQEKRCAMMMSILGTLNPYQMTGREMIWP